MKDMREKVGRCPQTCPGGSREAADTRRSRNAQIGLPALPPIPFSHPCIFVCFRSEQGWEVSLIRIHFIRVLKCQLTNLFN